MVILAAIGTFVYYIRTESGKHEWQVIVLKLPVVGVLARYIYITRFAENLGALLNGGIPVVRALTIVSEVVGNQVFEKIILKAADEVKSGGAMSNVLIRQVQIPPIVSQMVRIGEETGTLSKVLQSVARFYDQEVDNTTKALMSLLEPILIVFLGIGVGIMVVGVLMPIYNIAGQL
jgi:type IV pilus assembly protein PilC